MAASCAQPGASARANGEYGLVFNIAHFSLHDGPGIRTTVFLKGCPLQCWWCHNPESQSHRPEVIYLRERCRRCGDCVKACPQHALRLDERVHVDDVVCQRCGTCVEVCFADAREIAGKWMTVAEVLAKVERDRVFYEESGGGVTLSGGEPLYQPEFAETLLRTLRSRGIHTVLDTCGFVPARVFQRVAEYVDLFLFDLKVIDETRHRELTGATNRMILDNLTWLAGTKRNVIVRVPVIPGYTDSDENLREIARLAQSLALPRIDLLPYHHIAINKYERLGKEYRLKKVAPPDADRMDKIADGLTRQGFQVHIGG